MSQEEKAVLQIMQSLKIIGHHVPSLVEVVCAAGTEILRDGKEKGKTKTN